MKVIEAGWVTLEEAAHEVDVSAETLRGWCRDGLVDSFRDGPHRRFVRLDHVQSQVRFTRGGVEQTSLHRLIASHGRDQGAPAVGQQVIELQTIARGRLVTTPAQGRRRRR